jgi:hypothetical protein
MFDLAFIPPDPIEPQTIFMCEGYNFKAFGDTKYHILNFMDKGISCESGLPQTLPFYGPLNGYGVDGPQSSPVHAFGGDDRNAFLDASVNECRQIRQKVI